MPTQTMLYNGNLRAVGCTVGKLCKNFCSFSSIFEKSLRFSFISSFTFTALFSLSGQDLKHHRCQLRVNRTHLSDMQASVQRQETCPVQATMCLYLNRRRLFEKMCVIRRLNECQDDPSRNMPDL